MKKVLKILIIVRVFAFVVLQFIRIDKSAPAVVQGETLEAAVSVPPQVSNTITTWAPASICALR